MLSSNTQFDMTGPTTPELLPWKCWAITWFAWLHYTQQVWACSWNNLLRSMYNAYYQRSSGISEPCEALSDTVWTFQILRGQTQFLIWSQNPLYSLLLIFWEGSKVWRTSNDANANAPSKFSADKKFVRVKVMIFWEESGSASTQDFYGGSWKNILQRILSWVNSDMNSSEKWIALQSRLFAMRNVRARTRKRVIPGHGQASLYSKKQNIRALDHASLAIAGLSKAYFCTWSGFTTVTPLEKWWGMGQWRQRYYRMFRHTSYPRR